MMCTFNELPLPACAYFTDYGFSVPFFLRLTLIRVMLEHSSSCSSQKNDHRYLSIAALHIIVAALLCVHTIGKLTRKLGPSFDELHSICQDEFYLLSKGVNFHCVGESVALQWYLNCPVFFTQ